MRRTIPELLVRYKLEPSLRDVYVEGEFDRDILTSALSGSDSWSFAIYPIDCVDITQADLEECGLTEGNKQRLIALASKISRVGEHANYLCLIDRDLDHWFTKHPTVPRLKWTKYCSIESHFITHHALEKIAILAGKAKVSNVDTLFKSTIETLRTLYALRLADRELNLQMSWVPIKRYLVQGETSVGLNFDGYVRALLNKNGKMAERDMFEDSANRWADQFSDEHRLCCRGHDFTDLLAWIVSKFKGVSRFGDTEVISRAFILAAQGNQEIAEELSAPG